MMRILFLFYDYYQPEGYIAQSDTYIKKDASIAKIYRIPLRQLLLQGIEVRVTHFMSKLFIVFGILVWGLTLLSILIFLLSFWGETRVLRFPAIPFFETISIIVFPPIFLHLHYMYHLYYII